MANPIVIPFVEIPNHEPIETIEIPLPSADILEDNTIPSVEIIVDGVLDKIKKG